MTFHVYACAWRLANTTGLKGTNINSWKFPIFHYAQILYYDEKIVIYQTRQQATVPVFIFDEFLI